MSFHHGTCVLSLLSFVLLTPLSCLATPTNGLLPQEGYLWQRNWNEPVHEALRMHGSNFAALTVLQAEVTWKGAQPQVVRVPLDYAALTNAHCPIGLALRIGAYHGPFSTNDSAARFLAELAHSLIAEARSHHLTPRELQLDFDCADSKLEGYRRWLQALRSSLGSVPLSITALPSWLSQPRFGQLVRATDGFVLQVHSLECPRQFDTPFTLCDPEAARRAVERAAQFQVPFRVALPTYGYLIAFDQQGRFVGLSAEGPGKSWPDNVRVREVRADPLQMAGLVQHWTTNHPALLRGVIWYRLPISDDILNWRWPTLSAIMAGRSPREHIRAEAHRVEPGLVEINLVNDGELDISSRLAAEVRWSRDGGARLLAADGLRGFAVVDGGPSTVQFQSQSQSARLPAGERQVIGWLRFTEDREVQVELKRF
jgi:hypothetical protein